MQTRRRAAVPARLSRSTSPTTTAALPVPPMRVPASAATVSAMPLSPRSASLPPTPEHHQPQQQQLTSARSLPVLEATQPRTALPVRLLVCSVTHDTTTAFAACQAAACARCASDAKQCEHNDTCRSVSNARDAEYKCSHSLLLQHYRYRWHVIAHADLKADRRAEESRRRHSHARRCWC
jgi:hypothetical protein